MSPLLSASLSTQHHADRCSSKKKKQCNSVPSNTIYTHPHITHAICHQGAHTEREEEEEEMGAGLGQRKCKQAKARELYYERVTVNEMSKIRKQKQLLVLK